jgi:hypothetical protein
MDVAEDLGVDEHWLRDVANGMEIEDGAISAYGARESGVQTPAGITIRRPVFYRRSRMP